MLFVEWKFTDNKTGIVVKLVSLFSTIILKNVNLKQSGIEEGEIYLKNTAKFAGLRTGKTPPS